MGWKVVMVSLATWALWCLAPASARADEIVLDDGSRLAGVVAGLADGTLTLRTDYAELVKVKKGRITAITTDGAVEIHLASGEIIKGKLKTGAAGAGLLVEHEKGRSATAISLTSVVAVNPPPKGKWHGNVSLSGTLQGGNSDRSALSFGADSTRKGDGDSFSMRLLYNFARESGAMTTRNVYGALQYNYFLTKKLYDYLGVELLNDPFKDLDLRTVVGPGVGYRSGTTTPRPSPWTRALPIFLKICGSMRTGIGSPCALPSITGTC